MIPNHQFCSIFIGTSGNRKTRRNPKVPSENQRRHPRVPRHFPRPHAQFRFTAPRLGTTAVDRCMSRVLREASGTLHVPRHIPTTCLRYSSHPRTATQCSGGVMPKATLLGHRALTAPSEGGVQEQTRAAEMYRSTGCSTRVLYEASRTLHVPGHIPTTCLHYSRVQRKAYETSLLFSEFLHFRILHTEVPQGNEGEKALRDRRRLS